MKSILSLGTETPMGQIVGIGMKDGERYYLLINEFGAVSLMPADTLE